MDRMGVLAQSVGSVEVAHDGLEDRGDLVDPDEERWILGRKGGEGVSLLRLEEGCRSSLLKRCDDGGNLSKRDLSHSVVGGVDEVEQLAQLVVEFKIASSLWGSKQVS